MTEINRTSYGFFPQMKAEGIAFKREKSGAIVVGTNPGFHNGVLIVDEKILVTDGTDRTDKGRDDPED